MIHFRRGLRGFLAVAAILALVHGNSTAGEEAWDDEDRGYSQSLEELFQTETVYPQEKGDWQITLLSALHRGRDRRLVRLPVLIEYGLSDQWEIGLKWDAWVYNRQEAGHSVNGIGDLELETKYSFMNIGGSDFHAALGLGIQFPLGSVSKEISEGFIEYEPFVVVARDFGSLRNLQLFIQAGLSLVDRVKSTDALEEVGPAAHELFVSGGFSVPVGRFVFSGESSWSNNRWNLGGEENEWYVTPGVTWKWPHDWEVGIGLPIGLTEDSDRWRFILQFTKEF